MSAAQTLADHEESRVTVSHLEMAIAACDDFEGDFKGAGNADSVRGYL